VLLLIYVALICDHRRRISADMQSAPADIYGSFEKCRYVWLFCRYVGLFCRYVDHRRISDMQSAAARRICADIQSADVVICGSYM